MTTSHLINANRFEDTYQLVILSAQREESPRPSRVHIAWGFFPFAKLRVRMTRCTQFGPPIRVSLRIPIYEMALGTLRRLLRGEVICSDRALEQRIIARDHGNASLRDHVVLCVFVRVEADDGSFGDMDIAVDNGAAN